MLREKLLIALHRSLAETPRHFSGYGYQLFIVNLLTNHDRIPYVEVQPLEKSYHWTATLEWCLRNSWFDSDDE